MPDFITTNLSRESPNDFHTNGENIVTAMTEMVETFPNPPVKLTEIQVKLDELRPYLQNREELSTIDRKKRDGIMAEIVKMLQRNGRYVIMLFPDDEIKQLSSKFPSVRTRQRMTGPPDQPSNVRVRRGELAGELIANCRKQRGTKSVNVMVYNEKTRESYTFNSPSGTGIKINGLVSGDSYVISLQAVDAKGTSNFVSADPIIVG